MKSNYSTLQEAMRSTLELFLKEKLPLKGIKSLKKEEKVEVSTSISDVASSLKALMGD
jgi:hypothetical protein